MYENISSIQTLLKVHTYTYFWIWVNDGVFYNIFNFILFKLKIINSIFLFCEKIILTKINNATFVNINNNKSEKNLYVVLSSIVFEY